MIVAKWIDIVIQLLIMTIAVYYYGALANNEKPQTIQSGTVSRSKPVYARNQLMLSIDEYNEVPYTYDQHISVHLQGTRTEQNVLLTSACLYARLFAILQSTSMLVLGILCIPDKCMCP